MAFSVRAADVEADARKVAVQHGTTITGALRMALKKQLAASANEKEAEFQRMMAEIKAISEAYLSRPSSGLTEQDVMGWDDDGLPT